MADEKKPPKKEHKLTICQITQTTDGSYFTGWTDEEKAALDGPAAGILNVVVQKLSDAGFMVQEAHCIIHDKDTQERWSERLRAYTVANKLRHFHLCAKFLKFNGVLYSGKLVDIAKAVGVEPQYVEKASSGRYGWDNMLAYQIHAKDADKYQYDPSEVASTGIIQTDPETGEKKALYTEYEEIYALRKVDWELGRAKKITQQAALKIDELEEKILRGEIGKNQVLLTDSMYAVYARNKRRCDDAFETCTARRIARTVQAMENGEFKLSVFFVTGPSHAGKSYFTDALAEYIKKRVKKELGQDWSICDCAASNPVDDYDGAEILVMDDLRGMAMGASDWLKLLDPDRIGMMSARYHNKRVAARAIIINSEKPALEFFYYLKNSGGGDRSEAIDQFFRRILARVIVYRVPANPDVRRMLVGHMREIPPKELDKPGSETGETLTVHHDFLHDERDLSFDEALEHLSEVVVGRNNLLGGKRNEQET